MIREMLGIAEGILQDLHNDHNEVASLIGRIADSNSASERDALFREMASKLLAHAHAEQDILYARMESSSREESRRFAIEGKSEHTLVEQQVQKLRNMHGTMSETWTAELKVLEDLVEHHVDEEEGTGFGSARDDFDKDQLEAMGRQFQARKQELMATIG
jgi:hemerythrin-like domain-containing protein